MPDELNEDSPPNVHPAARELYTRQAADDLLDERSEFDLKVPGHVPSIVCSAFSASYEEPEAEHSEFDLERERDAVLENAEAWHQGKAKLDIMALSDHLHHRFPDQGPMSCVALLTLAEREAEETP